MRRAQPLRGILATVLFNLTLLAGFSGEAFAQQVLVSNIGQTNGPQISFGSDRAISFSTGSNSDGYTLTSVEVQFAATDAALSGKLTTTIRSDKNTAASSLVGTLTNPNFQTRSGASKKSFTTSGINLEPSTTYWLVFDVSSQDQTYFQATKSKSEDASSAAGWSIGDVTRWRGPTETTEFPNSIFDPIEIGINGTLKTATGDGVTIAPTTLALTEGDETASEGTYTVVLNSDPGATVTIAVASADTAAVRVDQATLTFTSSGADIWSTAKTVTVTAVDDGDITNESVTINHTASVAGDSSNVYHGINISNVTASVTDAGHGVIVSESSLAVTESGSGNTATYTLRLKSEPGGTIRIEPTSSDTGKATVAPTSLDFNNNDWDDEQTVTVTGVAAGSSTISHEVTAASTDYPTSTNIADVAVTVSASVDNVGDLSFSLTQDDTLFEEGNSANKFTVFLTDRTYPVSSITLSGIVHCGPLGTDIGLASAFPVVKAGPTLDAQGAYSFDVPLTWSNAVDHSDSLVAFAVVAFFPEANKPAPRRIILRDNDATVVSLSRSGSGAVDEGDTVTFDVSLGRSLRKFKSCEGLVPSAPDPPAESIEIPLVISGAGISPADYTLTAENKSINKSGDASGVILTGANSLTPKLQFKGLDASTTDVSIATVTLTVTDDTDNEGASETLTVALGSETDLDALQTAWNSATGTNVGGGADRSATANQFSVVVNDDDIGTVTPGLVITESAGSTTVTEVSGTTNTDTYTVALATKPSANVAVRITSSDENGATATVTPHPMTFTRAAGTNAWNVARTVTVTGVSDGVDQSGTPGSRTVTLTHTGISTDSDYSGELDTVDVTVTDDNVQSLPVITVDQPDSITEGGDITWTLTATPPPATDLTVNFWIGDPSGSDFLASDDEGDDSVTIGTSGTTTYTLSTVNDTADEPNGAVTLTVYPSSSYTLGDPSSDEVLVEDDDEPGVQIQFASAKSEVIEGDRARIEVVLAEALPMDVTIPMSETTQLAVSPGDYAAGPYDVTFEAGDTSVFLEIQTVLDNVDEDTENFHISLHSGHLPTGVVLGPIALHTVSITDPSVSLSVDSNGVAAEGGTPLTITATRGSPNASGAAMSIPIRVRTTGTTAAAADYTVASSISIPDTAHAGTASFTVAADGVDESDETVVFELGTLPTGTRSGVTSHVTLTITDNDATVASLARTDSGVISEGGLGATFTVKLGRALKRVGTTDEIVDVPLALSGTGIVAGEFTLTASGTGVALSAANSLSPVVTFTGAMARTATLTLAPLEDNVNEGTETLTVALGPDGNAAGGFDHPSRTTNVGGGADPHASNNRFDLTIEEGPPVLYILVPQGGYRMTEGGSNYVYFEARLSRPLNQIFYAVMSTHCVAVPGELPCANQGEYPMFGNQREFYAGSVSPIGPWVGAIAVDNLAEGEERFEISIAVAPGTPNPDGVVAGSASLPARATVIIEDSLPVAKFTRSTSAADEDGGAVDVAVRLSPPSNETLTLNYSLDGTAVQTTDYNIANSGTLSVAAGESSAAIRVTPINNSNAEPDKTIILTLTSGNGYALGGGKVHTLTIADDDTAPVPEASFAQAISSVNEDGSAVGVTINLAPAPATALTLNFSVSNSGSATQGTDYAIANAGTLNVAAGSSTATITVTPMDDSTYEGDETVVLTLASGTGYAVGSANSHTLTVVDDDPPPIPAAAFASGSSSTSETSGQHNVTVNLSSAPTAALTLTYIVGGTATENTDFSIASSGSLTVAIGATSATIPIVLTNDSTVEGGETVVLTLTGGSGYTVGSPTEHTLTIADDDAPTPSVSVVASPSQLSEGDEITFTVSRSGPTGAALTVTLDISESADFVRTVHEGEKTVTIPTGASSAAHYLSTKDDNNDEPDGTVTATVLTGTGYNVGSPSSATVNVEDDDETTEPAVSVSGPGSVTEGDTITFTLTANPAPTSPVSVRVDVAFNGDFAESGEIGQRNVSFAVGQSQATVTVRTHDDSEDESDGSATVTVLDRDGYSVAGSSATTAVRDDDVAAPTTPTLSIYDGGAKEGRSMVFRVDLSQAPLSPAPGVDAYVQVSWRVAAFTGSDAATLGEDVPNRWGQITFVEGQTRENIIVPTYNDAHDDPNERFRVVLYDPRRVHVKDNVGTLLPIAIADGEAIGIILNSDPLPEAWQVRFGRSVAQATVESINSRRTATRSAGFEGSIAGAPLTFGSKLGVPSADGFDANNTLAVEDPVMAGRLFPPDRGPAALNTQSNGLLNRLLSSHFTLTRSEDRAGGRFALWGRGIHSSFRGQQDDLSLDGRLANGMLGADYARGDWLFGLTLSQIEGQGDYRAANTLGGMVKSSLTTATPWAAWQASERFELWGAFGYGIGDMTLRPGSRSVGVGSETSSAGDSFTSPARSGEILKAGTNWTMSAAGLRGQLFAKPGTPSLAVVSDALWTRTMSDRIAGLAASNGELSRLRLGLESGWTLDLGKAGRLTPRLALGTRYDDGDAETGFGLELGGGSVWQAPALGIRFDIEGRTLILHEDDAFKDHGFSTSFAYDPTPATQKGLTFRLRQDVGRASRGGIDALFNQEIFPQSSSNYATGVRWTAEAAYGIQTFDERFVGTPTVGIGTSTIGREYSLGWHLVPVLDSNYLDFVLGLKLIRRASLAEPANHGAGIELRANW